MHFLKDEVKMTSEIWKDTGIIQDEKNDYRMTALSHPKRVLELYRDRFFRDRMTLE